MKKIVLALSACFLLAGFFHGSSGQLVILDSDGGNDIDNAADARIFYNLAAAGKISGLGYVACDSDPYNASANKAYQNFLGRNTQISAYQGSALPGSAGHYTQNVTTQFAAGDSRANYPDFLATYRRLLSGSPNASVTIVIGGYGYCLDQLLQSASNLNGDGFPSGLAIIQNKVKQVIWVAGNWPNGSGDGQLGGFGNTTVANASQDLLANWPSTIPFIFYGLDQTSTGTTGPFPSGACTTSSTDPWQLGFFVYYGGPTNPCTRPFWTQPTFIFVTQGLGTNFTYGGLNGTATYNAGTGVNAWTSTPGPFSYLHLNVSEASMQSQVCVAERINGTNWC